MVDPIKVGVGLSGTIASHKTLTLVVGMTMITTNIAIFRMCYREYGTVKFLETLADNVFTVGQPA
jgi:hypothetical protein